LIIANGFSRGFSEDDLAPISALQHFVFCRRQCALIHIERAWDENRLTAEGRIMHDRVHRQETETHGNCRIVRGLRLRSLRLGLIGVADVVEFHRYSSDSDFNAEEGFCTEISRWKGLRRVVPIEYKRGKPKTDHSDEVQLCAQALCLQEMLNVSIEKGFLFYGLTRHRHPVSFTKELHEETETLASAVHAFLEAKKTPPADYAKRCERCSIVDFCLPRSAGAGKNVQQYIARTLTVE